MNKKTNKYKFEYIPLKIIIIFQIIKIISNECNKGRPFKLSNNTCISQCSEELLKTGECIIDNQIIKTQWLNNIVMIDINRLKFFNFIIYSNGDMIFETSKYECTSMRMFYGLKKNGRYYFRDEENKETPLFQLNTKEEEKNKYESSDNVITLNNKEYIISVGRLESNTEIYDFENKTIYSIKTEQIFGYQCINFRGNLIRFNYNNRKNCYFYECIYCAQYSRFFCTEYNAVFMKIELSINELNEIIFTGKKEIKENKTQGDIQSCFITEQNNIMCFFYNISTNAHYNILAFNQDLTKIGIENIQHNNINSDKYYYCIHYQGEMGAFIYYKYFDTNYYPYIFFKKLNIENSIIENVFSTTHNFIKLDKYIFNNGILYNDFILLSKSKFALFSLSEDLHNIYIVILNIVDFNKIKINYYSINAYELYNYRINKEIKAIIYNKFIIFGSSQCFSSFCGDYNHEGIMYTSLMIFSYPNGTDENINIINYLYKNNQIKINNLIFDLYSYLIIDNNIFGYILYGMIIQSINIKKGNINLVSLVNNNILNNNDELDKNEKIKVKFYNNNFGQFEFNLEYAFIVTEPEYNEYNKYTIYIDTNYGDDNEEIYNSQKELYIGKTLYFNSYLNEDLTKDCNNIGCDLCLLNNKNYCVTCKYNFTFLDNEKICDNFVEDDEVIDYDSTHHFHCSNEDVINNKCMDEVISNEQLKEVYDILTREINNKNFNSTIVKTQNAIFQISTIEEQNNNRNNHIYSINFGECEKRLKKNTNSSLIILKTDIKSEDLLSTYVLFDIYDSNNSKQKLDLGACNGIPIEINAHKVLDNETLNLFVSLNNSGYNLFNPNDSFYNDICSPYTSIYKKDMLLSDRWEDIYIPSNEKYFCQENCEFNSYNITSQSAKCKCIIGEKHLNTKLEDINFNYKEIIDNFKKSLKNSNFRVLKCYKFIFDFKRFIKNIGSIIMAIIMIIFSILMIIFIFTGQKKINKFINYIYRLKSKMEEKNNKKNNNNKTKENLNKIKTKKVSSKKGKYNPPLKKVKTTYKNNIFQNFKKKIKNINKSNIKININNSYSIYTGSKKKQDISAKNLISQKKISTNMKTINLKKNKTLKILENSNKKIINKQSHTINFDLNDYEMNDLKYVDAIKLDKRTFIDYYISLLKKKHLILFAFVPINDYNLNSIKISLFWLSFSSYYAINGLFFDDKTMHSIYKDEKEYNIIIQISIIIYSSIISSTLNILFRLLALSEKNILSIKEEEELKNVFLKSK